MLLLKFERRSTSRAARLPAGMAQMGAIAKAGVSERS